MKNSQQPIKDFLCLFFARPRVHEDEIKNNSSRNHRPISTSRSGKRWLGLHEDYKRYAKFKQAARLANERLEHQLAPYGYAPVQHTPSLWKHESNGILFSLVVDDFGIKYT